MRIDHTNPSRILDNTVMPTSPQGGVSGSEGCLFACCRNARTAAGKLVALILFFLGPSVHLVRAAEDTGQVRSEIVGKVYPIIEMDALEEIEARIERTPFDPAIFGSEEDWAALKSPVLPTTSRTSRREVIPFFSLSFDIPDGDGNILYPKGYTFNPLEYLTLPNRLIIVNESQLAWALGKANVGDMVLLSGGNALAATRHTGQAIFKLEADISNRFNLKSVPSIVRQEGSKLIIDEILPAKEKSDG